MKFTIEGLMRKLGHFNKPNLDHPFTIFLREEAIKWECILDIPDCFRWSLFGLKTELDHPVKDK